MIVVIPFAGLGERLKPYTNFINKGLLPYKERPLIFNIIDSYPKNYNFIIGIGYGGEICKKFIQYYYPNRKIKFIKIDKFKSNDGSLGYTLFKMLKYINEPFLFHANDTIIEDKNYYDVKKNTIFITKQRQSSKTKNYRTINLESNKFIFNDKKKHNKKSFIYVGLMYIAEFDHFKSFLLKNKKNYPDDSSYIKYNSDKFEFKLLKKWIDIGNIDNFEKYAYSKNNILPKAGQHIFFNKKKVIKYFYDKNILNNILKRSKLMGNLSPKLTKVLPNFLEYNFINGKVFNYQKDYTTYDLLNFFEKKLWKKIEKFNKKYFQTQLKLFYQKKTISRIRSYLKNSSKDELIENINGLKNVKFQELEKLINWNLFYEIQPFTFHGDLHYENIIIDNNKIKLLDMRESFSGILNYGDKNYDLAKILHGIIIDHEVIKKNQFSINDHNNKVSISLKKPANFMKNFNDFKKYCDEKNENKELISLICILIYLNIATLHHYPYSRFLFLFGKYLLNKSLNEKKNLFEFSNHELCFR